MKPNQEQRQYIRVRLLEMLSIRETYDEVYDHVLTALEAMPDNIPFNFALTHIIEYELGGRRAIRAMQLHCVKTTIKQAFRDYYACLIGTLMSPLMFLVITVTVAYYVATMAEWLTPNTVGGWSNMMMVPAILLLRKKNKQANWIVPKLNYAMSYVKNNGVVIMFSLPGIIWWSMSDIFIRLHMDWRSGKLYDMHINAITVNISTIWVFLTALNAVVFYKLYEDFLKQQLVTA